MKKNDFVQIKSLDIKELTGKAKALKKEMADLYLDKNMKKLKDLKSISKKKKDLAQILTVLKQKVLLSQLETKISKVSGEKEVVMDNSTKKSASKKKGRTELSKTK